MLAFGLTAELVLTNVFLDGVDLPDLFQCLRRGIRVGSLRFEELAPRVRPTLRVGQ